MSYLNILIVEDEAMARRSLANALTGLYPEMKIAGETGSVTETLEWLRNPDNSSQANIHRRPAQGRGKMHGKNRIGKRPGRRRAAGRRRTAQTLQGEISREDQRHHRPDKDR